MKLRNISIICLGILLNTTGSMNAQTSKTVEIIKHDSLLYRQDAVYKDVCPMMDFELGLKCERLLRVKKANVRNNRKNGGYTGVYNEKTDLSEYESNKDPYFWSNYSLGEYIDMVWKDYKKNLTHSFEHKHGEHYDEAAEKADLKNKLQHFNQHATYKPLFFKTIAEKYEGSVSAYVDDLYAQSIMSNPQVFKKFIRKPSIRQFHNDLGAQMTIAQKMYNYWLEHRHEIQEDVSRYVYMDKTSQN